MPCEFFQVSISLLPTSAIVSIPFLFHLFDRNKKQAAIYAIVCNEFAKINVTFQCNEKLST